MERERSHDPQSWPGAIATHSERRCKKETRGSVSCYELRGVLLFPLRAVEETVVEEVVEEEEEVVEEEEEVVVEDVLVVVEEGVEEEEEVVEETVLVVVEEVVEEEGVVTAVYISAATAASMGLKKSQH
ncbi:unnamed protein product [Gadus morhua 'NCC']